MIPTARGVVVGIIGTVLYGLAWYMQIGWFYVADALIWGILLVNIPLPWLNLRGLTMRRLPPAHISQSNPGHTGIFEDDPVTLGVQVHNRSILPGFLILLREHCPLADIDDRQRECIMTVVGPKSSITATHDISCHRRGVYTLPPVQVETSAPFGLFRARRTIDAPMEVAVYPRVLPFGTMTTIGFLPDRPRESAMPRSSGEVRGSREYLPGDQPSSIHWKNSARRGRLMVKEFDEAPQEAVRCAFNPGFLLGEDRDTTLEYSIKIAASLAHWCFREGRPFRMWPSGKQHNAQTLQGVLEHLASIEVHADPAIRALVSLGGSGTAIAVASAADAETLQVLQESRGGTGLATVVLLEGFSPREDPTAGQALQNAGMDVVHCRIDDLTGALASLSDALTHTGLVKRSALASGYGSLSKRTAALPAKGHALGDG